MRAGAGQPILQTLRNMEGRRFLGNDLVYLCSKPVSCRSPCRSPDCQRAHLPPFLCRWPMRAIRGPEDDASSSSCCSYLSRTEATPGPDLGLLRPTARGLGIQLWSSSQSAPSQEKPDSVSGRGPRIAKKTGPASGLWVGEQYNSGQWDVRESALQRGGF